MPTFKHQFFKLGVPISKLLSLPAWQNISGIKRIIPLYHAVTDNAPEYLKYLYPIRTVDEFKNDMDQLLKHYKPVELKELIEQVSSRQKISDPVFHLTFDDGLKEFYHTVAPILQQKGIPATCFLNNSFIDNKDMLFRMKASLIIDHLHHQPAGSPAWKNYHEWAHENNFGDQYYRKLLLGLKFTANTKLADLASRLKLSFSQVLKDQKPYMTSTEITDLIKRGFTFGAHSFSHPNFNDLSGEQQLEEVRSSTDDIIERFSLNYKVFSFPFTDFGLSAAFIDDIHTKELCSLSFGCAGIKPDVNRYHLQRIPVEEYTGSIKSIVQREYMYQTLLRLVGKGKMIR